MPQRFWGDSRVTFLVGADGKIAHVWPDVDPGVHANEVLKACVALAISSPVITFFRKALPVPDGLHFRFIRHSHLIRTVRLHRRNDIPQNLFFILCLQLALQPPQRHADNVPMTKLVAAWATRSRRSYCWIKAST